MSRKLFIAGNWKMNTTLESGLELAKGLKETIGSIEEIEMAFFPPAVYLKSICDAVAGSNIGVGCCGAAQVTLAIREPGSYTLRLRRGDGRTTEQALTIDEKTPRHQVLTIERTNTRIQP